MQLLKQSRTQGLISAHSHAPHSLLKGKSLISESRYMYSSSCRDVIISTLFGSFLGPKKLTFTRMKP